jgi:colanic acid/amylovoran biosynthesis glycosyltransferase
VCHFHGLDLSSSLGNKWYRRSLEVHAPRFAAAITVGTRQCQMLAPFFPPERTALIPCGVPVAEFTRREGEVRSGEARFVTVSRLVPQKGVDHVIRALATLPPGMARLDIVGDGPERAALERLAQDLGTTGEVTFLGAQPPSGVRAALSQATALIQHSLDAPDGWFEGFGVTVAEASAMEVPTIASRCGGLMDQVINGETGFLVPQRDHGALASAMRRLAEDSMLRDRMGHAARIRTTAMFDMEGQVAKLENLLLSTMKVPA